MSAKGEEKGVRAIKNKIGLIVNPVAGMGGSVGLKGTDGEMYEKVLELGAKPVTPKRTKTLLSHIKNKDKITLVVVPGKMGEEYIFSKKMGRLPITPRSEAKKTN